MGCTGKNYVVMLYGSIGNGCKGEKFTGKSRVLLDFGL
jgi:hypothetical protein